MEKSKNESLLLYSPVFFLLIIFVNLHLLRNLSFIFEPLLLILLMTSFFLSVKNIRIDMRDHASWLFIFILLFTIYVISLTFFKDENMYGNTIDVITIMKGSSRILIMPLVALCMLGVLRNYDHFQTAIKIFIYISILAALSFIYQYYFGEISWFAGKGGNRIVERFSSLHGSLTVSGTTLAIALICVWFIKFNNLLKLMMILILIIGLAMTLQKVSLVNLPVLIFLIILFSRKKVRTLMLLLLLSFFCSAIFYSIYLINSDFFIIQYINAVFGWTLTSSDAISGDSIQFRLYGGALNMFGHYGYFDPLIGMGLQGAGSSMGIAGGQSHNTFWDIYFMGGPIYLFLFILFTLLILYKLLKNQWKNDSLTQLFLASNVLLIINCLVGAILFFHPVTSFIFWLSFAYSVNYLKNSKVNRNE